jgi:hypothetical protein
LRFPPKKGVILTDLISFQIVSEKSCSYLRLEFPSTKMLGFTSSNFPKNLNPVRINPFRPQIYYKQQTKTKNEEFVVWKFYEAKKGENIIKNLVYEKQFFKKIKY